MADSSYRRVVLNRNSTKSGMPIEEMTENMKNDIQLAFNLYKNEKGFVNKLKMRTLLFSFAMYKSSPKDINDFIAEFYPNSNEFTFDQLVKLVNSKLKTIKEKEAEDLFSAINNGKHSNVTHKKDIQAAFQSAGLDVTEREVAEMVAMMAGTENTDDIAITKDDLKKFYIEK